MTIYRLIPAKWMSSKKVLEGQFSDKQIKEYNAQGYNIYYLPNYPSDYNNAHIVVGSHIDCFAWVFVDCDLKDKAYSNKEEFLEVLGVAGIPPTKIIDSGNGVHAYWKVSNLDAKSYLRFQRRLARLFVTDIATTNLFQLMRYSGTINTKIKDTPKVCELIYEADIEYTSEELNNLLPPITTEDEIHCNTHYDKTYNLNQSQNVIDEALPAKFGKFLKENHEAKDLFAGTQGDRSKADYRLGHLMFANNFTKDEALSVLVNCAKALDRAPVHRKSYAENIVNQIWTYELAENKEELNLSDSVENILSANSSETLKGTRIPGHTYIDNTAHGFRLGQVIGLVAGVGVGKTAISMNLFHGFVKSNPHQLHLFVSLEQPAREIAQRWEYLCGEDKKLHSKVHVLSNYNENGTYRNLSLFEIQEYILKYQTNKNVKFGCVVVDHLGVLKKQSKNGENEGLIQVCQQLKSFAIITNTLLVIQSQSNREKAGIGDLELNKDAAYGTQAFESFLDYLVVAWQPLKRKYDDPICPTITAIKFAKIRFKDKENDKIKEDIRYLLYFDTKTGLLRPTTQLEDTSFVFFNQCCANIRRADRKTEVVPYESVRWSEKMQDLPLDKRV